MLPYLDVLRVVFPLLQIGVRWLDSHRFETMVDGPSLGPAITET